VIHQQNIDSYRLAKLVKQVIFTIKPRCSKKHTIPNALGFDP
jgi:hypothetical protein